MSLDDVQSHSCLLLEISCHTQVRIGSLAHQMCEPCRDLLHFSTNSFMSPVAPWHCLEDSCILQEYFPSSKCVSAILTDQPSLWLFCSSITREDYSWHPHTEWASDLPIDMGYCEVELHKFMDLTLSSEIHQIHVARKKIKVAGDKTRCRHTKHKTHLYP